MERVKDLSYQITITNISTIEVLLQHVDLKDLSVVTVEKIGDLSNSNDPIIGVLQVKVVSSSLNHSKPSRHVDGILIKEQEEEIIGDFDSIINVGVGV